MSDFCWIVWSRDEPSRETQIRWLLRPVDAKQRAAAA